MIIKYSECYNRRKYRAFLNLRRGLSDSDLGAQGRPPIQSGVLAERKELDEGGMVSGQRTKFTQA